MSALLRAPVQRTAKGLAFDRFYDELKNLLDGKTPEDQKKAVAANQAFIKGLANPRHNPGLRPVSELERAVTPTAVHVDTLISTFSKMYANDAFIGERLMPPVPVGKRSDKYSVYPKRERLAFPSDSLGFRSQPNEVDQTRQTENYSVNDYGLMNFLDLETVVNQDAPLNEMLDLSESILEGIAFNREKRISTIVQASGNYAGNTAAAASKWDNATTGGSIVADILAAKAAMWRGAAPVRRVAVTTLDNYNTCIANNFALRDLFKYTGDGLATTELVARFFGLDELLIAEAREDTANEGQTASYSRIWTSDFFAILNVAVRPSLRSAHFGSTFRMNGDPYTTQWVDPKPGKRGGIYEKVAVSEDHKIVAGDAAYYISDVKT
jgi:hypothetical protein